MPVPRRAQVGLAGLCVSLAGLFLIHLDVDLPGGTPVEFVAVPMGIAAGLLLLTVPAMASRRQRMAEIAGLGLALLVAAVLVRVVFHEGEPQGPILADLAAPIAIGGLLVLATIPWMAVVHLASRLGPPRARRLSWIPIAVAGLVPVGLFLVEASRLLGVPSPSDANEVLALPLWVGLASGAVVAGALFAASVGSAGRAEAG